VEEIAAAALMEVTPRQINPGLAVGRIQVDPALPIDPLSITFINSQGRVLHPPTEDWASGQIQAGAFLQSGQLYTVGLARCNNDPNLQIQLFVDDKLATTLLDADGDGYYMGDLMLPGLQAADAQESFTLRFVVTTGGVEEATSATVETPISGVVRAAVTGQPLVNVSVAALVSQESVNSAFALLPASTGAANPQLTDASGSYSFTVPSGLYRLDFALSGYQPYRTDGLVVDNGLLAQDVALSPVINEPTKHTIYLTANGIEPSLIIVRPAEVVQWINQDLGDHSVVRSGGWDSGVLTAGQSYVIKAPGKGIYLYTDQVGALGAATILVDDAPPVSPVKKLYLPLVRR
jgi:plastocyanin